MRRIGGSIVATVGAMALASVAATSPVQAQTQSPVTSQSPGTSQAPTTQRISDDRDENAVVTGEELKAADFPGLSFAIPGTKARIGFGGYVKLDAIADLSGVRDKYELILDGIQIPAEGGFQRDGYFFMTARESRFYVDFRNITATGKPLRVYLETDFWMKESSDFRLPIRLRHLYAVYDNVVLGYTWATVTDPLSWPITIDFSGEILNGGRRAVLLWERPGLLPRAKWAVGIENDTFPVIYNPSGLEGESSPRFPILAARINQQLGTHPNGHWMLGAQVRELRWDGPAENAKAMSWVVAFSGRAYLGKSDFFTWNAATGDGVAGNTSTLLRSDQSAVLTSDGRIETVFGVQATFGFSHYFSPTLASSVSARAIDVERHPEFPDEFMWKAGMVHIGLVWSPFEHFNTGGEYIFGRRTNVKGDSGNAHRLQYMVKYIF